MQFEENDYRVMLFNCYSEPARQILCAVGVASYLTVFHHFQKLSLLILLIWQAAKKGLKYPKYTWILYDWYPEGWWISENKAKWNCSNEEMKMVLERAISFRRHPPIPREDNDTTDSGIVSTY